jgi:acetylglutamate kinase
VKQPRRRPVTRRGERGPRRRGVVVLKLGGELLEDAASTAAAAEVVSRASRQTTLVVVHGGGREIDAALAQASIPKHQVDGLRVTDAATLQVVVAVLAGSINTRFVAAINAAGGRAVGLTGADAGVAPVVRAQPHRATNGELVDLGLVGEPVGRRPAALLSLLCAQKFVPVVACIGATAAGELLNVNADTLAGHLAARLRAARLVVAGGTAGVLDAGGQTIDELDAADVDALVSSGTATAGMIAKLRACRVALGGGVADVVVASGRSMKLGALTTGRAPRRGEWTRLV